MTSPLSLSSVTHPHLASGSPQGTDVTLTPPSCTVTINHQSGCLSFSSHLPPASPVPLPPVLVSPLCCSLVSIRNSPACHQLLPSWAAFSPLALPTHPVAPPPAPRYMVHESVSLRVALTGFSLAVWATYYLPLLIIWTLWTQES